MTKQTLLEHKRWYENQIKIKSTTEAINEHFRMIIEAIDAAIYELDISDMNSDSGELDDRYHR